jgi:hypothetical protein
MCHRAAVAAGAPRYTVEELVQTVVMPAYTELLAVDALPDALVVEATRGLFHLWSDGYHGGVCITVHTEREKERVAYTHRMMGACTCPCTNRHIACVLVHLSLSLSLSLCAQMGAGVWAVWS